MSDTILDRRGIARTIHRGDGVHRASTDWYDEAGRTHFSIEVHFGLCKLAGNALPYFSLVIGRGLENGSDTFGFGGADHETIVREFPELADMAALHLSDSDGAPMYAEPNGWYWLAGALGGAGEKYHGGQSEHGRVVDPLGTFAKHIRVARDEAALIVADVLRETRPAPMRARWRLLLADMRPRFKAEADAAIAKYGLTVSHRKGRGSNAT